MNAPDMIQLTIDRQTVTVTLPATLGAPVMVDNCPLPGAARWWRESPALGAFVRTGLIYRMEPTEVLAVVEVPEPDDVILSTSDRLALVRREVMARPRALAKRFGLTLLSNPYTLPEELAWVLTALRAHNLRPVTVIDSEGKGFVGRPEAASAFFTQLGLNEQVAGNRHLFQQTRTLLRRPGDWSVKLVLDGRTWSEERDGLLAITDAVDQPYAVTLAQEQGHRLVVAKGIVRPPLTIHGVKEPMGFCTKAMFGQRLQAGHALIRVVKDAPLAKGSLNHQALLFGTRDTERYLREENAMDALLTPMDLLHGEDRRKAQAGIPPGLLMDAFSPWKRVTQYDVGGVSALAMDSPAVKPGTVRLTPATRHALEWAAGEAIRPGTPLIVHRDPARPDASSMAVYAFAGLGFTGPNIDTGGVILNSQERCWKHAGGDFDGDYAVVWLADRTPLRAPREGWRNLRARTPVGMVQTAKGVSLDGTLLALANGFESNLGPAVMTAMMLAEHGGLSEELALTATSVIQAAVDSKKHPVDLKTASALYTTLLEARGAFDAPSFTQMMNGVRRAHGLDEKVAAWKQVMDWAREPRTGLNAVMAERATLFDRLFRETGLLRGSRLAIPEVLKERAMAELMDRGAIAEIEVVRRLANAYRAATRRFMATDEDARDRRELDTALADIELALLLGTISPHALLAYGPARVAAQLVSAADIEALAVRATQARVLLQGEVTVGEYAVEALRPIDSDRFEWHALVHGAPRVAVLSAEGHGTYTVCLVQALVASTVEETTDLFA